MPNKDGSGPHGEGALTGRGLGVCPEQFYTVDLELSDARGVRGVLVCKFKVCCRNELIEVLDELCSRDVRLRTKLIDPGSFRNCSRNSTWDFPLYAEVPASSPDEIEFPKPIESGFVKFKKGKGEK